MSSTAAPWPACSGFRTREDGLDVRELLRPDHLDVAALDLERVGVRGFVLPVRELGRAVGQEVVRESRGGEGLDDLVLIGAPRALHGVDQELRGEIAEQDLP